MQSHTLLISVNPKYVNKIIQRLKTIELRRLRPNISNGDKIVIYSSSPEKSIKAIAIVNKVISASPDDLWIMFNERLGINHEEFLEYFEDKAIGYAIELENVTAFPFPVDLATLKSNWPSFHPPQCYKYLTNDEFAYLFKILVATIPTNLDIIDIISEKQLAPQLL